MKRFGELNVKVEKKDIFEVPRISITEVINCEIEVMAFLKNIKTKHGDRYLLLVKHDHIECKFFTDATPIKQALDQIPEDSFPFLTTIRQQRFGTGSGKTYHFT